MNKEYSSTARAYLSRAQARIAEDRQESWIYAALELRCGIEARLKEYLEAQTHIAEQLKQGWQIPKMAKSLRRAFDVGDKFLLMRVLDAKTLKELTFFLYTPVTKDVQELGGKLGEFLHAPQGSRDNAWWDRLRQTVRSAASGLEIATRGTLLGVPLMKPDGKSFSTHNEIWEPNDNRLQIFERLVQGKYPIKVEVRYFDELVRQDSELAPSGKSV